MQFEDYEKLREADKKEFLRLSNKLLSQCFISQRENRKDYRFISRNKELFNNYFIPIGFRLEENDEYRIFQLVNTQGLNRKQFNLNETIILLIVRILYDEKKRELNLINDVVITPGEIQDHYMAIRKGKNITKTDLHNALATLRRFHIINYGKVEFDSTFDLADEDTPIIVYDTVVMAVPIHDIKDVYEQLEQFKTRKDPVEINEEAD